MDSLLNFPSDLKQEYGIIRFNTIGSTLASCCEFILAENVRFVTEFTQARAEETRRRWEETSQTDPTGLVFSLNAMGGCFGAIFCTQQDVEPFLMYSDWTKIINILKSM